MKRLIELLPFGLHVIRNVQGSITLRDATYLVITRILLEGILLFPLISSFYYEGIFSVIGLYSATYLLMISVYEIFYIYNDVIAIRWEDKPTYRRYTHSISISMAVAVRIIYIFILLILLSIFQVSSEAIAVGLILLISSLVIHNHQKTKIYRIFTFGLVRFSRLLFTPFIILYHSEVILYVPIIVLPYFITEIVEAYRYQIKHYNVETPEIKVPYYISYGVFLPIQMIITNFNFQAILGNILITLLSLICNLLSLNPGVFIKSLIKRLIDWLYQ